MTDKEQEDIISFFQSDHPRFRIYYYFTMKRSINQYRQII